MKKFLTRLFLYTLPFTGLILLLFLMPVDKQLAYRAMLKSCERSDYLSRRIFASDTPIDIAFLGTSMTLCGVQDAQLEKGLSAASSQPLSVANLGFCRPGRTLQLAILEDLLKAGHKPRLLFLEVRYKEDRFSHKDFPYIASNHTLFSQTMLFNQRYFEGMLQALKFRFQYARKMLLGVPFPPLDTSQIRPHSYVYVTQTADPAKLEAHREKQLKIFQAGSSWSDAITYRYPKKVVEQIAEMARNAGIPLVFLYLKSYGQPAPLPQEVETYRQYGEVWVPPDSIFFSPQHYSDNKHLNASGARKLTLWLETKILQLPEKQGLPSTLLK